MNREWCRVEANSISGAWGKAFLKLMEAGTDYLAPLTVQINVYEDGLFKEPIEISQIRSLLDQELEKRNEWPCDTVANTIFPWNLWNSAFKRKQLFERYIKIWPRIRKEQANLHGTYFQRLVAFGINDTTPPINQLDHIIRTYRDGNHRASALQAVIMDPKSDHTDNRQRGFPCMQHVIFTPYSDTGELDITGIFANQHIFEKAYGNYLGLYRLGKFMAHELDLKLTRVMCMASKAQLGNVTKQDLRQFKYELQTDNLIK